MPKMGIAVDETTRDLLRKHGGHRHIGALIGIMIRLYDHEHTYGWQTLQLTLDRIEEHLCRVQDQQESKL